MFAEIPLNIRNTIRMVLSKKITTLQEEYTNAKMGLSRHLNALDRINSYLYINDNIIDNMKYHVKRKFVYLGRVKKIKAKLAVLHNVNWYTKYPFNNTNQCCLVESERQLILHYLRVEVSNLYMDIECINEDIHEQKSLAINDGTLQNRIEFLHLNVLQNQRRKILRKIERVEEAVKFIKLSLRGKVPSKKPLTFKRKIRKMWYEFKESL